MNGWYTYTINGFDAQDQREVEIICTAKSEKGAIEEAKTLVKRETYVVRKVETL